MKYCVPNRQRKFGAKIFSYYTDIATFVLGYFNFDDHVCTHRFVSFSLIFHNSLERTPSFSRVRAAFFFSESVANV